MSSVSVLFFFCQRCSFTSCCVQHKISWIQISRKSVLCIFLLSFLVPLFLFVFVCFFICHQLFLFSVKDAVLPAVVFNTKFSGFKFPATLFPVFFISLFWFCCFYLFFFSLSSVSVVFIFCQRCIFPAAVFHTKFSGFKFPATRKRFKLVSAVTQSMRPEYFSEGMTVPKIYFKESCNIT